MIIFVPGIPQQKGSTRSFAHPKSGKVVTMGDNPKAKDWQQRIALAASAKWNKPPTRLACKVIIYCYFERPNSHFGTGRNADTLKPSAPDEHTTRPDLDKLVRCALDALTGIVWVDDSQVIEIEAFKRYRPHDVPQGMLVEVQM